MAEKPNNIAKIRKQRGFSQQQLSERLGAHTITISNLERGQTPLTDEWLRRLSEALQVEEAALLKEERPQKVFVGAEISGDRLIFWENEKHVFKSDSKFAVALSKTPPPMPADIPRWTIVNDDSFYPVFRALDVIRLVPLREDIQEIVWARGRLCIALSEGIPILGYLQHTSKLGSILLDPIGKPPVLLSEPTLFVVDRALYQPDFPSTEDF